MPLIYSVEKAHLSVKVIISKLHGQPSSTDTIKQQKNTVISLKSSFLSFLSSSNYVLLFLVLRPIKHHYILLKFELKQLLVAVTQRQKFSKSTWGLRPMFFVSNSLAGQRENPNVALIPVDWTLIKRLKYQYLVGLLFQIIDWDRARCLLSRWLSMWIIQSGHTCWQQCW